MRKKCDGLHYFHDGMAHGIGLAAFRKRDFLQLERLAKNDVAGPSNRPREQTVILGYAWFNEMKVKSNDPGAGLYELVHQACVKRTGPLFRAVGQIEMLGRFPVYADDNGVGGRLT